MTDSDPETAADPPAELTETAARLVDRRDVEPQYSIEKAVVRDAAVFVRTEQMDVPAAVESVAADRGLDLPPGRRADIEFLVEALADRLSDRVEDEPEPVDEEQSSAQGVIRQTIEQLEDSHADGAPKGEVIRRVVACGVPRARVEAELRQLKRDGKVYEPMVERLRTV